MPCASGGEQCLRGVHEMFAGFVFMSCWVCSYVLCLRFFPLAIELKFSTLDEPH